MPLYEYECGTCEKTVEVLLRRSDETAACPVCGNEQLSRVFSLPASPAVRDGASSLPVAGAGEACGAPRCCGGGCQM